MAAPVSPRKYRIERYLAEGGMGAIYVGKKIGAGGFEKEVVLKQLLPEFTSRAEFRDLFFREAKISATLDHQNIVRTFDLVKSEDRLFIVMEYVRGADLRSIAWRARRRRPLSPHAILHVGLEILAGLSYAHRRRSPNGEPLGIIHRDLSPSNILCSAEGEVKLSDFGIAKAVTYSSVFYRVRGKVGYMSPEMARNQPIDARSDLFSLGVSLYETFIGERVFAGDLSTPADKVYSQRVLPLASRCPHLPSELQGVFDKALALDRDARFSDAESFADAIRQVASKHGLLYTTPQLAAELRDLLGPDPDLWLNDTREAGHADTDRPAAPPPMLAGQEASSVADDSEAGLQTPTPVERPKVSQAARPSVAPSAQGTSPNHPASPPAAPVASLAAAPAPRASASAQNTRTKSQRIVLPRPHPRGGVAARRRPRRRWWIAVVLLAAALGAGAARLVFSHGHSASYGDTGR